MKESVEFLQDIAANEELKKELQQFLSTQSFTSEEEKVTVIVKFAKEKGYETAEEELSFAKAKLKSCKLTDEQLQEAAGGEVCVANYNCGLSWNCCVASNECFDNQTCDQAVSESCRGSHNSGGGI